MPAYNLSILISDCYGSAGSITFYHRDGKCRWRRRSSLSFTGTPAQCAALSIHRRALAAWRTISDTEKERWHDIAKNVQPRRPPFGSGGHITGHNLFVSAYHGFVTLGDEHIPEPVEHHPFPVFVAEFVSASVANSSDLRILLRLLMPLEKEPERYALLCKVQLTEAGKGCNPGKMRNFLAEDVTEDDIATGSCPSRPVALTIPVRTAFPGVYAATCKKLHHVSPIAQTVNILPQTTALKSLFDSFLPYTDSTETPSDEWLRLKVQEAVMSLLAIDTRFYPTLFDFSEAWKIDLMDFMEQNYTEDLTLEEFASYTGRSLATFKRDFAKISPLPPQRWIMEHRLEKAKTLLLENTATAQDVGYMVGFKNRSHFSQAFKKRFGYAPSNYLKLSAGC